MGIAGAFLVNGGTAANDQQHRTPGGKRQHARLGHYFTTRTTYRLKVNHLSWPEPQQRGGVRNSSCNDPRGKVESLRTTSTVPCRTLGGLNYATSLELKHERLFCRVDSKRESIFLLQLESSPRARNRERHCRRRKRGTTKQANAHPVRCL